MEIRIYDVGHGLSALVLEPNGYRILVDCGKSREFQPLDDIRDFGLGQAGRLIDELILTNLDEDHLTDIANVVSEGTPSHLLRNEFIGGDEFANIKRSALNRFITGKPEPE